MEELGLEIRSSAKNPRFLDNQEWNPKVKDDVQRRLGEIGVHEEHFVFWLQRGEPTPLEEEIKPVMGVESEYCIYEGVRDRKLKIHEALHYASYIRNFFIAHKFSDVTKHITPYDVHNMQMLARLLLLNRFGLWKKSVDDLKQELEA